MTIWQGEARHPWLGLYNTLGTASTNFHDMHAIHLQPYNVYNADMVTNAGHGREATGCGLVWYKTYNVDRKPGQRARQLWAQRPTHAKPSHKAAGTYALLCLAGSKQQCHVFFTLLSVPCSTGADCIVPAISSHHQECVTQALHKQLQHSNGMAVMTCTLY